MQFKKFCTTKYFLSDIVFILLFFAYKPNVRFGFVKGRGKTAMGMREFANHVIAVGKENGLPVTNLQLQKVMFFALGFYIGERGIDTTVEEIYNKKFERWKYGPVVGDVYRDYSLYGSDDITEYEDGEINDRYGDFDVFIIPLLKKNPFILVEVSHSLDSWAKYREDIIKRNAVPDYELDEIQEDFKDE